MLTLKKTTSTARELGVPVYALHNWIRHGVIPAPQRDDSGHFVWGSADIETARRVRDERRTTFRPAVVASR